MITSWYASWIWVILLILQYISTLWTAHCICFHVFLQISVPELCRLKAECGVSPSPHATELNWTQCTLCNVIHMQVQRSPCAFHGDTGGHHSQQLHVSNSAQMFDENVTSMHHFIAFSSYQTLVNLLQQIMTLIEKNWQNVARGVPFSSWQLIAVS